MILLKLYFHLKAFFLLFLYKIIYGKSFQFGKKVHFRKGFTLIIEGKEAEVSISDGVFFNNYCSVCAMNKIEIGKNTIFGENVKIYDHNHNYKNTSVPIKDQGFSSEPIIIGENCWIGSNVVILKGVKIGDNAVIGAGCIVFKDVESGSVIVNKQSLINI